MRRGMGCSNADMEAFEIYFLLATGQSRPPKRTAALRAAARGMLHRGSSCLKARLRTNVLRLGEARPGSGFVHNGERAREQNNQRAPPSVRDLTHWPSGGRSLT